MGDGKEWRTSSFCASRECVETASADGAVLVRDKADREGPVLEFAAEAWNRFSASLKAA